MTVFVVDLERVIEVEVSNDRHAALLAAAVDAAVNNAILGVELATCEIVERRTQAYRGKSGIRIWDSEEPG